MTQRLYFRHFRIIRNIWPAFNTSNHNYKTYAASESTHSLFQFTFAVRKNKSSILFSECKPYRKSYLCTHMVRYGLYIKFIFVFCLLLMPGCRQQQAEKTVMSGEHTHPGIKKSVLNEVLQSPDQGISENIYKDDTVVKNNYSDFRKQDNIGTLLSGPANQLPVAESYDNLKSNPDIYRTLSYNGEPTTSLNRYFLIDFENDVFTNTDYYFTNGMQISVIAPVFQFFGLSRVLPSIGKNALNYYGAGIRQNMYTGINPEATEITLYDRPFSGILYFEFFKISYDTDRKLKLSSSIRTGVLGSYSMASSLQSGLHDLYPVGWKYQIQNDIILNFQTQIEKGIISNRNFELNVSAQSSAGTMNTDLGGALMLRLGRFNGYFKGFYTAKPGTIEYTNSQKLNYWMVAEISQQFILYNATLNGGLFQKNSPYTLSYNELNHHLTRINIGISCFYKQNGIVLGFTQISPEIKGGRFHRWGSIRLVRNF